MIYPTRYFSFRRLLLEHELPCMSSLPQILAKAHSLPEEVLGQKDLKLFARELQHGPKGQQCHLRHSLAYIPREAEPGLYYFSIPKIWPTTGILLISVELENEITILQNQVTNGDPEAGPLAQYFSRVSFRIFSQISFF